MTDNEFTTAELLGLSNLMRARGEKDAAKEPWMRADMLAFGRVIGADDEFTPVDCNHAHRADVYDVEADDGIVTEHSTLGETIGLVAIASTLAWGCVGLGLNALLKLYRSVLG